jgi:hypothetical protein
MNKFVEVSNKFNNKLAVKITIIFGSMWTAHTLLVMALVPLLFPDLTTIIMYISTTIIQLVALSWIMVGNNVLSEKTEKRAEQDHKKILEQFEMASKQREETKGIINSIAKILQTEQSEADEDTQIISKLEEILQIVKNRA